MTDRPILFSGPMIRALLEGRKTQTRRVIKPQPRLTPHHEPVRVEKRGERGWVWMVHTDRPTYQFATGDWKAPYAVGDRLWVREGFFGGHPGCANITYRADQIHAMVAVPWKPSIFMPRAKSRLTLIVTDVRVQRLREISEADAVAEGCFKGKATGRVFENLASMHLGGDEWASARNWYADLWDSLNAKRGYGWEQNPWVVALTFEVIKKNIDQIEKEAA